MNPGSQEQLRWRLERAEGYLLLGMVRAARKELESLPAELQAAPELDEAWLQQAMAEKDWPRAAVLAARLRAAAPGRLDFWIWEAYARRRTEGVPSARTILEQARHLFPDSAIVPYNLACYASVEGDLEGARALLRELFKGAPGTAEMAAADEDLRPLWSELDALAG